MAYWREQSARVIAKALEEGRAQGLEGKDLVKHVDAAYPFGPREHFPYKAWLAERWRQLKSLLPPLKSQHVDPDYWFKFGEPAEGG